MGPLGICHLVSSRNIVQRTRSSQIPRLEMDSHNIHPVERPGAVWAFPHAIGYPVFDTLLAEDMPTGLQDRILEVCLAYRAQSEGLNVC
jgi:hypothetical protein